VLWDKGCRECKYGNRAEGRGPEGVYACYLAGRRRTQVWLVPGRRGSGGEDRLCGQTSGEGEAIEEARRRELRLRRGARNVHLTLCKPRDSPGRAD